LSVFGTQFNDEILSNSGLFKSRLEGDDMFFSGGKSADATVDAGYDFFDGGSGDDVLVLEGMPTRYTTTFDTSKGELTFTDKLPVEYGGEGTIKIKNIEKVSYLGPEGPFDLLVNVTGVSGDYSIQASLRRLPDDDGDPVVLTDSDTVSDGTENSVSNLTHDAGILVTAQGFDMFALSDTGSASIPNENHASAISWGQILGDSVVFDAEEVFNPDALTTTPPEGWTETMSGDSGSGSYGEGGEFSDGEGGELQDGEGGELQDGEGGEFLDGEGGEFQDGEGGELLDGEGGEFQDGEGGELLDGEGGELLDGEGGEFQDGEGGEFLDGEGGEFLDGEG